MNEHESLIAAINEEVKLRSYDELWPSLYEAERQRLLSLLPSTFIDIQHIGSTSIPGMLAKPIVDILAGVDSMETAKAISVKLCSSGYTTSAEFNESLSDRQWFMRWADGHRTHHLHVVVYGGEAWFGHIRFRDALRSSRKLATEYADLKTKLAAKHTEDREAYTDAKSHFVNAVSRAA
jgi:GrpB-like predicted nucleotidyltransferase (UPF0157 family)